MKNNDQYYVYREREPQEKNLEPHFYRICSLKYSISITIMKKKCGIGCMIGWVNGKKFSSSLLFSLLILL
jgi:hypothetical protein